jgi:hypothetical protein
MLQHSSHQPLILLSPPPPWQVLCAALECTIQLGRAQQRQRCPERCKLLQALLKLAGCSGSEHLCEAAAAAAAAGAAEQEWWWLRQRYQQLQLQQQNKSTGGML